MKGEFVLEYTHCMNRFFSHSWDVLATKIPGPKDNFITEPQ